MFPDEDPYAASPALDSAEREWAELGAQIASMNQAAPAGALPPGEQADPAIDATPVD